MVIEVICYILIGLGVFFALPSTIYTCMFLGIYHRRQSIMLEKDDLTGTHYLPLAERFKVDILRAKSIPCERVELQAKDGVKLIGRYYDKQSDKTILFVHGYQSNPFNNFSAIMLDCLEQGVNVLLIDQRAHGESGGRFTTMGHREQEDLQQWIAYAEGKAGVEHIFVYGISMGATTVGYASEHIQSSKVKGLVMEAGFTCFYDELVNSLEHAFMRKAALNYIYLSTKSILKSDIKQSVEASLKNNKIPVLFLHGDVDKEVTIDFTKRSFLACASKKKMVTVEGAGHTLCYQIGGETVRKELNEFMKECINSKEEVEQNG